jgi:hypothetical protein
MWQTGSVWLFSGAIPLQRLELVRRDDGGGVHP